MESRPIIYGAILSAALLACPVVSVSSQEGGEVGDFGVGHAEWHHWYETGENGGPLMRPAHPEIKCCGADCRPTKAVFKNGAWTVYVDGGWEKVPDETIKRNVISPDSGAHICASPRTEHARPFIYCFVPPEAGS